jgi:hypothetical protein
MAENELCAGVWSIDLSAGRYDNKKTTRRCEAEYQESGQSCTAKENRRAFAKKDAHCSRQEGSEGGTKEANSVKIDVGVLPILADLAAFADRNSARFISGRLFSHLCASSICSVFSRDLPRPSSGRLYLICLRSPMRGAPLLCC